MSFSTHCIQCDEYFESRLPMDASIPLMKIKDPDRIQAILHSTRAVRPQLMSKIAGESMVWIDGPDWLVRRRIAQGSFQPRNEPFHVEIVDQVVSGLLERLETAAEEGEVIGLTEEFLRMTTRFLYRFAFDIDLPADHDKAPIVSAYFDAVSQLGFSILDVEKPLDLSVHQLVRTSLKAMDREIDLIMDSDPDPGSLLGRMIEACDAGELTDRQVKDEVRGLFIAGTETTSLTLAWFIILLDENRSWRDRIEAELAVSREVTPLLDAGLHETMRLFPAVPFMTRIVKGAADLGFGPLEENTEFMISVYHTHRNPEHWDDPHAFDPGRFLGEPDRHRYAWMPFGGGRHTCIGNRVARMEARDTLRAIMGRYRFHRVEDTTVGARLGITLKPTIPINVTVERIQPA